MKPMKKKKTNFLAKTFWRGFLTLLPLTLTVYILYWIFSSIETWVRSGFRYFAPDLAEIPGVGVLSVLLLIVGTGFFMGSSIVKEMLAIIDRRLRAVPIVKTIYGSLKDFSDYFDEDSGKGLGQVALVKFADSDSELVGFLTNETPEEYFGKEYKGYCCVYLPMSYQVGGYMILIPKENLKLLEFKSDSVFRFIMTGGLASTENSKIPSPAKLKKNS